MREKELHPDKLDTQERRELDNSEFGLPEERSRSEERRVGKEC